MSTELKQGDIAADVTAEELSVIMQMSGDLAYSAAQISADLNHDQPDAGWTPRKVNKIHRSLRDKGYAAFGHLTSEDDNSLQGCGYWLCGKGWDIRYARATGAQS
jgi:hypothetical protein